MFYLARQDHTGDLKLQVISLETHCHAAGASTTATGRAPPGAGLDQILQFVAAARTARGGKASETKFPPFPANLRLLGGYVSRGRAKE
jgi:hypothetical protein